MGQPEGVDLCWHTWPLHTHTTYMHTCARTGCIHAYRCGPILPTWPSAPSICTCGPCMHTCIHAYRCGPILPTWPSAPSRRGCSVRTFMHACMHACMCMYVCMYVCMHACMPGVLGEVSSAPVHPHPHPSLLASHPHISHLPLHSSHITLTIALIIALPIALTIALTRHPNSNPRYSHWSPFTDCCHWQGWVVGWYSAQSSMSSSSYLRSAPHLTLIVSPGLISIA